MLYGDEGKERVKLEAAIKGCQCQSLRAQDDRYQKLADIIAQYAGQPGALIPVLHQAQEVFGYLPHDVQVLVAEGLDVPLSEIDGVITFYSLFTSQPQGKYKVGVCLGTACYVKGSALVLEELKKQLGIDINQTSPDGLFTLEVTRCVGACGLAPVMTIGDDVYGRLTPEDIPGILDKYIQAEKNGKA
ncbi:MAG: NAD(P)H-dependent oxidoreductase subunit E [Firmicutes bacterium]|nr:NAD(P)H-dependent oxidoreductase subunit E [Bacillota bacterium]